MTVEQLLGKYMLGLGEPARAVQMLYPFASQAYTFFTGLASLFILWLLIYLINLMQKNILWGLGCSFCPCIS